MTNFRHNDTLRISLIQTDIQWEDKAYNLKKAEKIVKLLSGKTDICIFPEMFTTGFSMNSKNLSEENNGATITSLKKWAQQYNIALCGSFIARENNEYYNRAFFISPTTSYFYDKRHLFRMGDESKHFSAGNNLVIAEHKGFNICLQVCYDLRFPVWVRNNDNNYDILIYVANWPQARIKVWDILLKARAIENLSYVCGVNRIGTDGMGLVYNGHSAVIDYKGEEIEKSDTEAESILSVEINKAELEKFRNKFPVWKDADKFLLQK